MLCAMMLKMIKNETLQAEKSTQTKCDGVDWQNAGDMKEFMQSLISGQVSPKAKTASLSGLGGLGGAGALAGLGTAGGQTQQQLMMCNLMKQRYANRYVSARTRQLMAMQGCQLPQGLGMGMGGGMYGMSNDIPSRLFQGNPQGQMMLGVHSFRSKIGDKFGWNTQDDLAYHVSLLQRKYLDMSIVPWDIMEVCIAQIRTHNDMDNGRRDCYRQWPGNIKTDDDCMKHGCVPFKNFCTRCPVIDPYLRDAADAEHSMRSGGFSVTLDRCAVETTKREYCIGFSSSTDNSRTNMMGLMMQQGGGGYNPMMSQMFNKKDLKDRCAALNCCFDEKAYQQKTMGGAYFQHLAGPFCYRERIIQQAKAWETEDVCLPEVPVSGESSDLMKTRCGIGADPNFEAIQLSSRIIGMDALLKAKVTETSRPWMVKVLPPKSESVSGTLGTENTNLKCSGVIICQKWVVTTASCLFTIQTEDGELMPNIKPTSLRIFYKNSHVNEFVDDADLTPAPVFSIKNHPLFRVGSFSHDIALVRTSLTIGTELNGVGYDALPICLPAANVYQSHGTSAYMSGYGASETRSDFALRGIGSIFEEVRSGQLLEIKNEIVANSICETEYGGVYSSTGTLCLRVHSSEAADVKKESCYGDGGGPVAVYDEAKKVWTLVGLIAGGSLDCDGRKPTIVTDIATYRPWIMEETKGCCNSRKMIVARG